ncbi:MAG: hypothetical protein OXT69_15210 [Candidatus Poribacteria bacterium]|nr:hypothetical protein [Candidatus Poribacteria bacterium]
MDKPSGDLEFLIDLYLKGSLNEEESRQVEAALMMNDELARLVEERRRELDRQMLDALPENELEEALPQLNEALKDICVKAERRPPHQLSGRQDRFKTPFWLKAGACAAAAALILAFVYGTRSYETDITELNEWLQQESVNRQEHYLQVELKRKIENARLIQHGRRDAAKALPIYEEIASSEQPHLWASRIAAKERASIMQASLSAQTLLLSAPQQP